MDQQSFKNGRGYMRAVLKMAGHSGTGGRNKNIKSEMMNKDGVGVGGALRKGRQDKRKRAESISP